MADDLSRGPDTRERLRADFHGQTARIPFTELQRYFAGGHVVVVGADLDLVEVAVALAEDDKDRFEAWISTGNVAGVSDDQARDWLAANTQLWAVVANPWVLVQETVTEPVQERPPE